MKISLIISSLGLTSNIVGTLILIIDTSNFFQIIKAMLETQQLFINSYMSHGDIYLIKGLDSHLKKCEIKSKMTTYIGLIYIIVGFVLQLIGLIYSS